MNPVETVSEKTFQAYDPVLQDTEQLEVNLGPQHPSTHGVFRMNVKLEGETILSLKPVMGYLHRNHEQIAENMSYLGSMPYTDRLDYFNSMSNNFGYALAVEKLAKIEVPERAQYIRVIMAELTRLVNHVSVIGFLLNDLGAFFTPVLYAFREREKVLDIFEETAGSRMMCNYFRFGGVSATCLRGSLRESKKWSGSSPNSSTNLKRCLPKTKSSACAASVWESFPTIWP